MWEVCPSASSPPLSYVWAVCCLLPAVQSAGDRVDFHALACYVVILPPKPVLGGGVWVWRKEEGRVK